MRAFKVPEVGCWLVRTLSSVRWMEELRCFGLEMHGESALFPASTQCMDCISACY